VVSVSRAWLYTRSGNTVRIVIEGANVEVFGPGADFSRSQFNDEMDAVLHHTAVEDALVRAGWTLERMTTERRSGADRRAATRGDRRRKPLRLVGD
jgi:hypothetical protein